jgi:hypothetical protein
MFGFIKKLFGGIFSFLGGLFGSKQSGYYMELEESKGSTPAAKPQAAQQKKLEPLPTGKPESAKATQSKSPQKKAETKPAAPIAKVEPAKPAPKEAAPAPKREATPVMVTPRRRPGANMTSYLDMARNMPTPTR